LYGKVLYLVNLTSLSPNSKLEDFVQDIFTSFYLNVDCLLWKGLLLFLRIQRDWRGVGIRVSYQIKRKRERKRRVARKKKETLTLFLIYTWNYVFIIYLP